MKNYAFILKTVFAVCIRILLGRGGVDAIVWECVSLGRFCTNHRYNI
jgi:hypothetical protein